MIRAILIVFVFSLTVHVAHAQFYKSLLPSPEFTKALEKIVLDYRLNFKTIKGDTLNIEGGVVRLESTATLPDVKERFITFYNSKVDTSATWQGVVYRGGSFREAVRAYENTFRLVKKSHLNWIDKTLMRFTGELVSAREDVGFASSFLYLDVEDSRYENFVAEIDLLGGMGDNWEVQLSFERKKDDKARY